MLGVREGKVPRRNGHVDQVQKLPGGAVPRTDGPDERKRVHSGAHNDANRVAQRKAFDEPLFEAKRIAHARTDRGAFGIAERGPNGKPKRGAVDHPVGESKR